MSERESLLQHFSQNDDRDHEKVEEDVLASLLGVIGYAAQSLQLRRHDAPKTVRYLRSESLRIKEVIRG